MAVTGIYARQFRDLFELLASPWKGLRAWTGSVATPAQSRKWRFYAESVIERAISILDAIDGDADLEDGGAR